MKAKKYIVYSFLLLSLNGYSQNNSSPFKVWQLTAFSGQARIAGNYRESQSNMGEMNNKQSDAYLNGVFQVRTQSFFVHPNFMQVNLNGTYNPETRRQYYIGVPNFSEKSNNEGVDVSAIFFKKKNINFTTRASMYNSIQNIENITSVKSKSSQLGTALSYSNKFLPFTLDYTQQKTEQNTLGSNRNFNMENQFYQATSNKSFTSHDNNSFLYLHTNGTSLQNDNNLVSPLRTYYNVDLFSLNNGLFFDKKKNYTFNSSISNSNERGSILYNRLYGQENLNLRLPKNFALNNSYIWGITKQELNKINNQGIQSELCHKLYESLNSRLFFQNNQTNMTSYQEQRNKIGIDLKYVKKIPTGKLSLSYIYSKEYKNVKTPSTLLNILREEYILSDNQITLLKNQTVNIQSVVVKDVTGAIIYQPNLDYILIDKNPYVEIVRMPGGLIANNASVYIDYTAMKPGLYNYNTNMNSFAGDVLLFKNKLNVYYRFFTQDFSNINKAENQILNYYLRHIVGVRLDFYFIKGGVEYEYYKSTINPYQGLKYFFSYQKVYKNLFFTFSANMTDFQISDENAKRRDMDITCKVAYSIFNYVKIDADYMYRTMKGRGIDLELQTSKIALTTNIHKLYISLIGELYWNRNLGSKTNYKGTSIQLTRNF